MITLTAPYKYGEGYIISELPTLPNLPESVQIGGRLYGRKPELHCSLINVAKASDLIVAHMESSEAAEERLAATAIAALEKIKPEFYDYLNDVRLVDQPERNRHTIIVMARVDGLKEFFAEINRGLNIELPVQPAHVTLFCENGLPIGINAPDGLSKWTRPLESSERHDLAAQLDPKTTFGWESYK